jgi:F-type H+-transporting ATPase subunit gamma
MGSIKDIRRRIRSVKNTGKITRAMELVSAAKMRRAIRSVVAIRPYAHSAWTVISNLAQIPRENKKGLLDVREVRRVLVVLVTSNRGLCGSFNTHLLKKLKEQLDDPEKLKVNRVARRRIKSVVSNEDLKIEFITLGKKGESYLRKNRREIIASFPNLVNFPKIEDVRPVSKIIIEEYLKKTYDKVVMFYTDYISGLVQQPKVRQIFPLSKIDLEKQIAEMDLLAKDFGLDDEPVEYLIEPSSEEVFDFIIPRLIEMQVYHAILESDASEQSARMMAMKSATESSKEMVDDLTLAHNQIRQMKITQEIAEISAGRAALES